MSMPTTNPRRVLAWGGFTLIEIIGAVAAFTIAFLAGSAAFARLLQQQNTSYQRTVAAAAAMLVTDWSANKQIAGSGSGFLANLNDLTDVPPSDDKIVNNGHLHFRGEDAHDNDVIRVFKRSTAGFFDKELATFQSLVITVSPASADDDASPDRNSKIRWRQVTFWQGRAEDVRVPRDSTVRFLSRYLVPDECP